MDLMYYDEIGRDWELAVASNTQNSPGYSGPVGDRFVDVGSTPRALSSDLGDYGVFWNPIVLSGFVWANVDHTSDFSPGVMVPTRATGVIRRMK
ncbi:MAG: hypothetical protein AB1486_02970 [Planctomycetota bacterium]